MQNFIYKADVVRVVDGDTIVVDLDLGFDVKMQQYLRLEGIDTPEIRTKDLSEKEEGFKAKEFVEKVLNEASDVYVQTTKTGKYGRYLATVYYIAEGTAIKTNLNQQLLDEGFAEPYGK